MQCNVVSFSGLLQWKSSLYTFSLDPPSEVKSCVLNPSNRVGDRVDLLNLACFRGKREVMVNELPHLHEEVVGGG